MNRASLLHILDHASGISEAEVRELEQLAAAFPYCQTAHLLLAKAAHDRGSMLAGQRLRRAATYAADRELLRALIELPPVSAARPLAPATTAATPAESPAEAPAAAESFVAPEPAAAVPSSKDAELMPAATAEAATNSAEETAQTQELGHNDPEIAAVEAALPPATSPGAHEAEDSAALPPETPAETAPEPETAALEAPEFIPAAEEQSAQSASEALVPQAAVASETPVDDAPLLAEEAAAMPAEAEATELPVPALQAEAATETAPLTEEAGAALLPTGVAGAGLAAHAAVAAAALPADDSAPAADELPASAPPIRPPVEAGSSRFEFGLGEASEPGPAYQLPELPEAPAAGSIPPYRADELLAYALSSGSRFGAALTRRDAELTSDLPLAPAWYPDAATLAHYAAHRPAAPVVPSSLALIDKFLRSQPRIKTAQRPAPTDAPQADLSVRSTSAAPSLASESLAKIMVRQGKIGRAIEIYEQLMQRQPEKKAYFAAQIDLLNQQPE
ncbi:hypothetical protein LJ737_16780 [Hymenobacter sp. 15J16-1T3B]|uniref:hypothetical protein n=1 Tax=Hymenobacter sp. 15J16-1T3B TaxID=2886941 RepID=UPI001D11042B|nr:hypothetical protein [Hymenobacter sp. 15J16-1T3B]MCC3158900.1 hypothetical protein [Hymenobacter sp. 15J16-1T3B]